LHNIYYFFYFTTFSQLSTLRRVGKESDGWVMKGDAEHYFGNRLKETDYKEKRDKYKYKWWKE